MSDIYTKEDRFTRLVSQITYYHQSRNISMPLLHNSLAAGIRVFLINKKSAASAYEAAVRYIKANTMKKIFFCALVAMTAGCDDQPMFQSTDLDRMQSLIKDPSSMTQADLKMINQNRQGEKYSPPTIEEINAAAAADKAAGHPWQ